MKSLTEKLSKFPLFSALKESWYKGYKYSDLKKDCLAGLAVCIVAIPLAMALTIAVGATPEQGLYTVMIAAPIIALLGGSRLSVSGPTAAFIVILFPIIKQYGIQGLWLATIMAVIFLVIMGIARLGTFIEFIPYPVETKALNINEPLPEDEMIYEISGPLFFGVAEKAMRELKLNRIGLKVVILHLGNVPSMDVSGLIALKSAIDSLLNSSILVILAETQPKILLKLKKAGINPQENKLVFVSTVYSGLSLAKNVLELKDPHQKPKASLIHDL